MHFDSKETTLRNMWASWLSAFSLVVRKPSEDESSTCPDSFGQADVELEAAPLLTRLQHLFDSLVKTRFDFVSKHWGRGAPCSELLLLASLLRLLSALCIFLNA